jgi:hypothetical protein
MSKVETGISDVKTLALRCKALEMQLRQTVPKKDHLEVTSKLERQVASLEKDLDRARTENQKTVAINKQIVGVEGQITAVIRATAGLAKSLDSLDSTTITTRKALAEQARTIDSIGAKIAQGTVPSGIHLESLSKIRNLESRCEELTRQIGNMVPSREFVALNDRLEDANRRIGTMVPASDLEEANRRIGTMVPASELEEANRRIGAMVPASEFAELKRRADDLEAAISTMVPGEQLAASEARVGELEGMLAYRVPQTLYDDLVSRVVSLAEAVTGGDVVPQEQAEEPQQEPVEAEAPIPSPAPVADEPELVAAVESQVAAQEQVAAEPMVAAEPTTERIVEPAVEVVVEVPATEAVQESVPEITIQLPRGDVPVPVDAPIEPTPEPVIPQTPVAEAPEIREVQSQLAELNTQAQEAQPVAATTAAAPEAPVSVETPSPKVVSVTTNGSEQQIAVNEQTSDDQDPTV